MSREKTNLASEFYVLSVLNRLQADAYLTLGNKKSVDIVVVRPNGETVDIEVKAVAGQNDWTVGELESENPKRHFVVLVSFENKLDDIPASPSCWVLPYRSAKRLVVKYETKKGVRKNIPRERVRTHHEEKLNCWGPILG